MRASGRASPRIARANAIHPGIGPCIRTRPVGLRSKQKRMRESRSQNPLLSLSLRSREPMLSLQRVPKFLAGSLQTRLHRRRCGLIGGAKESLECESALPPVKERRRPMPQVEARSPIPSTARMYPAAAAAQAMGGTEHVNTPPAQDPCRRSFRPCCLHNLSGGASRSNPPRLRHAIRAKGLHCTHDA